MTPAEQMQAMFAAAINWDVVDALSDEEIERAAADLEEDPS